MLTQIINGNVFTPNGCVKGGSVIVEGTRIIEISPDSRIVECANVIDATGMNVVPGAIDMHVHGGGGADFMEGTDEAFRTAVNAHLRHGTTGMFPTLASSSVDMICAADKACGKLMDDEYSPVLGLHLEGHYLNRHRAGGQMPQYIKNPDENEYKGIIDSCRCIKRWDAAPELPGATDFARYVSEKGIIAGIAHTEANYETLRMAWDAGFHHVTHFYNGMTVVHNDREYKHEGTVEGAYLIDDMTVELIGDGIHVPAPIVKLVLKIKGRERTAFVTDGMACSANNGKGAAFDPRVIIEDGVCKLSDRSALAGSIATMDSIIKTMVTKVGIPLADVMCMVAETPARIMGVVDRKGTLERGKDADILLFSQDMELEGVMSMGRIVPVDA